MLVATTVILLLTVLLTFPLVFGVKAVVNVGGLAVHVVVTFAKVKVFDEHFEVVGASLECYGTVNTTLTLRDLSKPSVSVGNFVTLESVDLCLSAGALCPKMLTVVGFQAVLPLISLVLAGKNVKYCVSACMSVSRADLVHVGAKIKFSLYDVLLALCIKGVKKWKKKKSVA